MARSTPRSTICLIAATATMAQAGAAAASCPSQGEAAEEAEAAHRMIPPEAAAARKYPRGTRAADGLPDPRDNLRRLRTSEHNLCPPLANPRKNNPTHQAGTCQCIRPCSRMPADVAAAEDVDHLNRWNSTNDRPIQQRHHQNWSNSRKRLQRARHSQPKSKIES